MVTLYLLPMQWMIKEFKVAGFISIIFVGSLIGLYKFWYKKLPVADLCEN